MSAVERKQPPRLCSFNSLFEGKRNKAQPEGGATADIPARQQSRSGSLRQNGTSATDWQNRGKGYWIRSQSVCDLALDELTPGKPRQVCDMQHRSHARKSLFALQRNWQETGARTPTKFMKLKALTAPKLLNCSSPLPTLSVTGHLAW